MAVVKVKNLENQETGELELQDVVFAAPLNKALIYEAVLQLSFRGDGTWSWPFRHTIVSECVISGRNAL